MKLRIKFTKHGAVRYIGHLDLQRYFQRVNRRAGIKAVYSEGFSPHQKMSFAMPLSVGYESDAEYFDLEVTEAESSKAVIDMLNKEQTEGIEVISCVMLPDKCENAMASVRAAGYTIRFREGHKPSFDIGSAVETVMESDSFIIRKPVKRKGKRGQRAAKALHDTKRVQQDGDSEADYKEVDIRQYIHELYADNDGALHLLASAGSENNIRPDTVMGAIFEREGISLSPYALRVTRNELYTCSGKNGELIPLSEAGRIF